MEVVSTVPELRAVRRALSGTVGLVPTMGFLHEGHLALVRASRERDEHTAVSIFVNPTQFGPNEDFERYPRDLERDLSLLEREEVAFVFTPAVDEMYPPGDRTSVEVHGITERLEGEFRPGHFRGVTTVCTKLFNIVEPDRAYFGRKDAQQLAVIRQLVRDLRFPIEIVPVDTVREADGVAMSSRNAYLSPEERRAARCLSQALGAASRRFADGERDGERLREAMRDVIAREPLARLDYVSVADAETLDELDAVDRPALASLAVRIGGTRLIDNVTLEPA